MVSIIIPVYNVENYINRCVESAINQSFIDFEIILVDDGSTDNSSKICDDYAQKDSRIRVIHKTNGGLSSARNVGMDAAIGDFIFFIDSDDWLYDRTVIEEFVNKINKENADIVVGKTVLSNRMNDYPQDVSSFENYFKSATCFSAWNKLYRASILKNERFVLKQINEDMPFTSKLLFSKKVSFIDKTTYVYFQRSDSIMHVFNEKRFDIINRSIDVFENLKCYQQSNILLETIVKERIFCFSIFGLAAEIFVNSKGKQRKLWFRTFFKMLDDNGIRKDFYAYSFKGILELHKKEGKIILKLFFFLYLCIIGCYYQKQK